MKKKITLVNSLLCLFHVLLLCLMLTGGMSLPADIIIIKVLP